MANKNLTLAIFVTTAILAALHQTTVAQAPRGPVTYVVGDDSKWIVPNPPIPSTMATPYEAWTFGKDFFVGDTLVFNFVNGNDDVVGVLSESGSCDTLLASSAFVHLTTSPAQVTLTTEGGTFFTSTYPGHCSSGQRFGFYAQRTSIVALPPPQADSTTSPSSAPSTPP